MVWADNLVVCVLESIGESTVFSLFSERPALASTEVVTPRENTHHAGFTQSFSEGEVCQSSVFATFLSLHINDVIVPSTGRLT